MPLTHGCRKISVEIKSAKKLRTINPRFIEGNLKIEDFNVGGGQQDQPPETGVSIGYYSHSGYHHRFEDEDPQNTHSREIKSTPNGIIHILGSCECRQMFPGMVESWSGADELQR